MNRRIVYFPHNLFLLIVLFLILLFTVVWVLVIGTAFEEVGFNSIATALILIGTFVGSYINIPIAKLNTTIPVVEMEFVSFLGIVYRIPKMEYEETRTLLAVNVGGALIPVIVSSYLLWKQPAAFPYALGGIAIVALVTHAAARPVKGMGIATPAIVPPLVAALTAYLLAPTSTRIVAYVAGVLGTLIGADLSNLHLIPKLGAPFASIGGAGTFDGVFLSGIIATLLA